MRRHALPLAVIFLLLLISAHFTQAQSDIIFEKPVSVDQNGTNADPSAVVDIKALNKGLLVPRISLDNSKDATTISSPAEGLLIYNTATINDVQPGFYYWKDACWNPMGTGVWQQNGDKIFYNQGGVGIGVDDPYGRLHVQQGEDDAVANFVHGNDTSYASAVDITTFHRGPGLLVYQRGTGGGSFIHMLNDTSYSTGLEVVHKGKGNGAEFTIYNQPVYRDGVHISHDGMGSGVGIHMSNDTTYAHGVGISTNTMGRGVSVYHSGLGIGYLAHMQNDTSHSTGLEIHHDSKGNGANIHMNNNDNNGAYYRNGMFIGHDGMGSGMDIYMSNDTTYSNGISIATNAMGAGLSVHHNGPGIGMIAHMANDTTHSLGMEINSESRGTAARIYVQNTLNNTKYYRDGLNIEHNGMGSGIGIHMNNDTTGANGLNISTNTRGSAINVHHSGGDSYGPGLSIHQEGMGNGTNIAHFGTGDAAYLEIVNDASPGSPLRLVSNNPAPGLAVHHYGTGTGIFVEASGAAPAAHFLGGDLFVENGSVEVSNGSFIDDGVTLLVPDYVFEDEYQLESIEEHAAYMWKEKHLPAVTPAATINAGKYNMAERREQILEELEKAHIYIEELHNRVKTLEDQESEIEDLKKENQELLENQQKLTAQLADIYQLLAQSQK